MEKRDMALLIEVEDELHNMDQVLDTGGTGGNSDERDSPFITIK